MASFLIIFANFLSVGVGVCLIALSINDFATLQGDIGLMEGIWHIYWMYFFAIFEKKIKILVFSAF